MKPDGTLTIEEVMEIVSQLQSWERRDLAFRIAGAWNIASDYVKDMPPEDLADLTGYYVSENEPSNYDDLSDYCDSDLIQEIIDRDLEEDMLDAILDDIIVRYIERSERIKAKLNLL